MGMKSKENGKIGEAIVESLLRKYGYWVHVTQRRVDGSQPIDVIAIRGNTPLLLDAKYVESGKRFDFSDVKPNQVSAMNYAMGFAGIKNCGFAIIFKELGDNVWFLWFHDYLKMKEGERASVAKEELVNLETILKLWNN